MSIFFKKRDEIMRLSYRVADLEERLCPCESHDWKCIGYSYEIRSSVGDVDTVYSYKCARCGKTMKSLQPYLDK